MEQNKHHQVVIIGGGTAGITVASSIRRHAKYLNVAIIEPADNHYYQPAFTLVGAGAYNLEKTKRSEKSLIPPGVSWIKDAAKSFDPEGNSVVLSSGDTVTYDYLVVCPGLALEWDGVEGLKDALGKDGVCSNYSPDYVEYTWDCIQNLKKGSQALFTQPPMPIKCPGAPQKIAYLAADYLRKKGRAGDCDLHFLTQAPAIFGVPYFARALEKVMSRYGINTHYQTNLVSINGAAKKATFEDSEGKRQVLDYDMLHVTPPQGAPDFIKDSPLAGEGGWISVDKNSLQHTKYANIFSLGDVCSTPNSKTAAAIRKQSPVVVRNILNMIAGKALEEGYDGYASCPLTTSYGKVLLAEFIYGGKVTPTLPLTPNRELAVYWWVKVTGLPLMYWHYMLKGYEWFFGHNVDYVEDKSQPASEPVEKTEEPEKKKAA